MKSIRSFFPSTIGSVLVALGSMIFVPAREGPGVRSYRPSGSIAQRNRHTGEPHEHKREIARRRRQAAAAGRA